MKHINLPTHLVIKDGIHGLGVFTTEDLKPGQVIFKMKGEIIHHPTRTSVQIGNNKHIEDAIAGHVNHSCNPNAKVDQENLMFITLRNIHKGEEITFDYNKNEDVLAAPFYCKCCNTEILGKKITVTFK